MSGCVTTMPLVAATSDQRVLVQPPHPQVDVITRLLPEAVLTHALSFLCSKSMMAATLVNRNWKSITVTAASNEENVTIERYIDFIIKEFGNLYPEKSEALLAITKSIKSDVRSLVQVKTVSLYQQAQVVGVLKTLTIEDLKCYQNTLGDPSNFLKNAFNLKKILVVIPGKITNTSRPIFIDFLVEQRLFGKAIEVAISRPFLSSRSRSLSEIVIALIEKNDIDRAITVTNIITVKVEQTFALDAIVAALIKDNGNINKAIEIAKTIPLEEDRLNSLKDIVRALATSDIDGAIEITKTIFGECERSLYYRSCALEEIVEVLTEKGDIDRAQKVADTIPGKYS